MTPKGHFEIKWLRTRTKTKCSINFPQATVLCFECVCVLLVRMFDIHQVLWCRFYVNSKLHIWKTNWWNVNLSPSIFFLSSYLYNGLKYFLEENCHFHEKIFVFKIYPINIYQYANKGWGVSYSRYEKFKGSFQIFRNRIAPSWLFRFF